MVGSHLWKHIRSGSINEVEGGETKDGAGFFGRGRKMMGVVQQWYWGSGSEGDGSARILLIC